MRLPLPMSTCSAPLPIVCENGKSPVRFCVVTCVGVSSWENSMQGARMMAQQISRIDFQFMLFRLLKVAVRQSDAGLDIGEHAGAEFPAGNEIFHAERHLDPIHRTVVGIDRLPK